MSIVLDERHAQVAVDGMDAPVSRRAREFCEREGLMQELGTALRLAARHFPATQATVDLVHDPDSDEEWVSTCVVFSGSSEDFGIRYRAYKRAWLAATEWPASHKIRFSFWIP